MMNIYQELLLDHYRYPRNCGSLSKSDFFSKQYNPSCGDSVQFAGCISKEIIKKVVFEGQGCVISQATASMLTEVVKNKILHEIHLLDKDFIMRMIGMQLGPIRIKCALLPLIALQEGIATYKKKVSCPLTRLKRVEDQR